MHYPHPVSVSLTLLFPLLILVLLTKSVFSVHCLRPLSFSLIVLLSLLTPAVLIQASFAILPLYPIPFALILLLFPPTPALLLHIFFAFHCQFPDLLVKAFVEMQHLHPVSVSSTLLFPWLIPLLSLLVPDLSVKAVFVIHLFSLTLLLSSLIPDLLVKAFVEMQHLHPVSVSSTLLFPC